MDSKSSAELVLAMDVIHRGLVSRHVVKTCINCDLFKNEVCTLYGARPPAETIVFGCSAWQDDVPF